MGEDSTCDTRPLNICVVVRLQCVTHLLIRKIIFINSNLHFGHTFSWQPFAVVLSLTCCIVTAPKVPQNSKFSELLRRTVKVKTRVHTKPGTRSAPPPRHQLTLQIWCAQQRLIASRLRQETLHWLRSERSAFLYTCNHSALCVCRSHASFSWLLCQLFGNFAMEVKMAVPLQCVNNIK